MFLLGHGVHILRGVPLLLVAVVLRWGLWCYYGSDDFSGLQLVIGFTYTENQYRTPIGSYTCQSIKRERTNITVSS